MAKHEATHNHPVNRDTWMMYPDIRSKLTPDDLERVRMLSANGVRSKRIQKYLIANSTATPTLKDIANLVRRMRSADVGTSTTEDRIKQFLENFSVQDSGNVCRVHTNEKVCHPTIHIYTKI